MMDHHKRNDAYEAAIRRAVPGKRVLDIGTGAGLLALMAARAGAAKVTTCEAVSIIGELAREIIGRNGFSDRINVLPKPSTDMAVPRDMSERAQVLITETFASGLITEGVLPTVEHAHEHLLTPEATVIPASASVMGYLAGGPTLEGMLYVHRISGFDLSAFNAFAPSMLATALDQVPHEVLSDDTELMRFDLREKKFPAGGVSLALKATRPGVCVGVVQWIRLQLDAHTRFENRPAPGTPFNEHWTHIIHRFPKLVSVSAGDVVPILFRHDRTQIGIQLLK
jgi:type II protein arginine methyltransferase